MENKERISAYHSEKVEPAALARTREANYLVQAIDRSKALFRPRQNNISVGLSSEKHCDLRIGLISREITFRAESSPEGGDCELASYRPRSNSDGFGSDEHYNMLVPDSAAQIQLARNELADGIDELGERGANLICVNELAYPAFSCPPDRLNSEVRQQLLEGDRRFRQRVQKVADEKKAIIVCGSYHDPRDIYNKSVIFFPEREEQVEHIKLTSAKSPRIEEIIRTPPNPYFPIYKTFIGHISVLICLDAYDLNMFFRQLTLGMGGGMEFPPDIIFVPAYSKSSLYHACEGLSYFSRAVVIYCNTTYDPYNAVFCAGKAIDDRRHESKRIVELDWATRDGLILDAHKSQSDGLFSNVIGTHTGLGG